jgi:hypothetical protein
MLIIYVNEIDVYFGVIAFLVFVGDIAEVLLNFCCIFGFSLPIPFMIFNFLFSHVNLDLFLIMKDAKPKF